MVLGYLSEALRASWPATFSGCRIQGLKAPVFWSSSFRGVETPRSLRQGIESAAPYLLESCIGNPLHLFSSLPMISREESLTMQVSVDVSDAMRREAESRGLPIIDYVELLVEKGRQAMGEGAVVSSALERIRALSSKDTPSRS
jgi:hypothetical protein